MKAPNTRLTHEDIHHLCGVLADWKVARILASGATSWAEGQDNVIGPAERPLAGRAALIYEIITVDEDIWGEDESP